ncbi:hypothetical protein [Actinokineospora sp. NBRC 105648]|uniref:hypothetical protein n=1 Tax=Actinokineospora sp. NBRC 105648 TaxID=3032206 RepID=UPI0024A01897|nr:hypothetical protein [Actinokineospora sp. NBRC 105648]GLZ40501.1 hypothetical protein Acsp05_41250 [Actinokineospora sp. NBRC 105648]
MRVPFALPASVVKLAGVALGSVVVSLLLAMMGALGHWSSGPGDVKSVSAKVLAGVPCNQSGQERISYQLDGSTQEATLDACGHQSGETVEVRPGEVVHLAEATVGATTDARPLAVVLLIFACLGGAGFVELFKRRPLR